MAAATIEEGGQAYSGKGIFSAMAQDRIQARPVHTKPRPLPQPSRRNGRNHSRNHSVWRIGVTSAAAAAWRELDGGSGADVPTYAQGPSMRQRQPAMAVGSTAPLRAVWCLATCQTSAGGSSAHPSATARFSRRLDHWQQHWWKLSSESAGQVCCGGRSFEARPAAVTKP